MRAGEINVVAKAVNHVTEGLADAVARREAEATYLNSLSLVARVPGGGSGIPWRFAVVNGRLTVQSEE